MPKLAYSSSDEDEDEYTSLPARQIDPDDALDTSWLENFDDTPLAPAKEVSQSEGVIFHTSQRQVPLGESEVLEKDDTADDLLTAASDTKQDVRVLSHIDANMSDYWKTCGREQLQQYLINNPSAQPDFQSLGHDIGASSREEVTQLQRQHMELQGELRRTRQKLADVTERLRNSPAPLASDPTAEAFLSSFWTQLIGGDLEIDNLRQDLARATQTIGQLEADHLRSGEHWLNTIDGLTTASTSDRSPREQSMWLFAQLHQIRSSVTLANVH